MREPMGTCPCPAGPPLEKLSNGLPGTRRTPVNTALAMDLHAVVKQPPAGLVPPKCSKTYISTENLGVFSFEAPPRFRGIR